jgi:adenosylcobinamide kinase / adenosylcobinamide-phosphate guanylyltransferase
MTTAPHHPGAGVLSARITFVLGGARSGKSRYAEGLVSALPPPWVYVATAEPGDGEMIARINAHRARRGSAWKTVEAPHELAEAIVLSQPLPLLVDCLTLWLSNIMLAQADIDAEFGRLERALEAVSAPVVLVSNEVGSGIVPDHLLGRKFRDLQGMLNQRIAARADRVVLMVAGLPLVVKGNASSVPSRLAGEGREGG